MRLSRGLRAALLWTVTAISLTAPSCVQSAGVSVRLDAIDSAPVRVQPMATARPHPLWVMPDQIRPTPVSFSTQASTWLTPYDPLSEGPFSDGVLQCVPYARSISGIGIYGDAWTWWGKAAGTYARGNLPEPGAVLSFPGIERMPLGHVAVVTKILGARAILIDHANWPNAVVRHGAISKDILVADVSSSNDWSEVRVQFGRGGPLGSVYPANGFIYGWSESGVRLAHSKLPLDETAGPRGLRAFGALAYFWALPPMERQKAYLALGLTPAQGMPARGRPMLVLGPVGPGLAAGAFGRTLGISPLGLGPGGRMMFSLNRFSSR